LLAQHQDDQVETLLLQLLRGAGVAGLAASPERAGQLLRPLLPVTRVQLQAWLRRRALKWSEDPSNADDRYARNFLRLKIMPLLRERWPALSVTLSRSAALAAEAQLLLAASADAVLLDAVDGAALRVTVLRRLAPAERRNALRRWLQLRGLPMPDQRRLQELAGPLLHSRHDAQPFIRWPGALVRRHGDRLHAVAEPAAPATPAADGAAAQGAAAAPKRLQWDWLREPRLALPAGGVFVTGGVVSSLGKGIAPRRSARSSNRAASRSPLKLDPYINVDPGTMSPFQHGEVFVTDDGAETDLDLGHYERFTARRDDASATTSPPARSTSA
jgi:hypothetical protein